MVGALKRLRLNLDLGLQGKRSIRPLFNLPQLVQHVVVVAKRRQRLAVALREVLHQSLLLAAVGSGHDLLLDRRQVLLLGVGHVVHEFPNQGWILLQTELPLLTIGQGVDVDIGMQEVEEMPVVSLRFLHFGLVNLLEKIVLPVKDRVLPQGPSL